MTAMCISDSGLAGGFHSATLAIFARSLRFRSTQALPRSIRRFVEPPAAPSVRERYCICEGEH